jgi:hypothetical protein
MAIISISEIITEYNNANTGVIGFTVSYDNGKFENIKEDFCVQTKDRVLEYIIERYDQLTAFMERNM